MNIVMRIGIRLAWMGLLMWVAIAGALIGFFGTCYLFMEMS